MRLFSYIVRHDSGFAPNPFHGHCTLAACKPKIRQAAAIGDWVVGLSARRVRVVYAMKVDEKLDFATYWHDHKFHCKRPSNATREQRRGDNIYEPLGNGQFRQLPSRHSKPPLGYHEDRERWARDGDRTLLSTVARGQEFVLDAQHYPEAANWAAKLMGAWDA